MYTTIKWFGVVRKAKVVCFKNGKPKFKGKKDVLPFDEIEDKPDERLQASISRTKSRIFEIVACNEWEWFFTGTLNPQWNDVENLNEFRKKLTQSIRDFRKATGAEVKYLLIPEQHKSGAWHIHGLFHGLPREHLHHFTVHEHLPNRLLNRIREKDDVYGWEWYSKKFGFTTLTPVRSIEACASYVTKYITKDLVAQNLDKNAHSYYASIGLNGADVIAEGDLKISDIPENSYENDYVFSAFVDEMGLTEIVAKMGQYEQ